MRLEISGTSDLLTKDFGKWLIKRIQEKFILSIDENKLKSWDDFFDNSSEYKSIYKKKILTKELLICGIRNLVCDELPQKIIIRMNTNQFVPGLDRVKIDSVCRLINFGNVSIKGYPIFTNVLSEVVDNIDSYVNEYEEGSL